MVVDVRGAQGKQGGATTAEQELEDKVKKRSEKDGGCYVDLYDYTPIL